MKKSISLSQRLRAIFLALFLFSGYSAAVSQPASAASDPWPWPHNGCTMAPDNIYGYSILDACNKHDGCYAIHWTSRESCDAIFLDNIQRVCRIMPFYLHTGCVGTSYVYYGAVRTFGWAFYNANSYDVRINTRMA